MMLAEATSSAMDVMFWVVVLVALLLLLAGVTLWLRRWLKEEASTGPSGAPFTLHDLELLRRSGKLTDAEFDKLRSEMLAQTKTAFLNPPKPPRPPKSA